MGEKVALDHELDAMRAQGVRLLTWCGWGWIALLCGAAATGQATDLWIAPALAALVALPSTIAYAGRHHGPSVRMALALAFAAYPAITVFALGGHEWQMDVHLYFLVALAALSLLYDVRAMIAAAGCIALHHVLAWAVIPAWAFAGGTDLLRVALHGGAVVAELAFLTMMMRRSQRLIVDLAAARRASEGAAVAAEQHRGVAESALVARSRAEELADDERHQREELERVARQREREHLIAIADSFENGITLLAQSLGGAAADLSKSAESLSGLAHETDIRADSVAAVAARSSDAAQSAASHVTALLDAVTDIGARTGQQAERAREARTASAMGRESVLSLIDRATQVEQFARAIGDLSTRTNLIAINASIEAARVGDAGRGFAVVAGEVKSLAGQASEESRKIERLVEQIRTGATDADGALLKAGIVLEGATDMADGALVAMQSQQADADAARARSVELAATADDLVNDTDALTGWAEATRRLSTEVRAAAGSLLGDADALVNSTREFVTRLRSA